MAKELEEKEEKKKTKTSGTKKTTTKKKKTETKEVNENTTEKKRRGRPPKKKEEKETKESSRIEDLTELMEKVEKETKNQKSKRKSKKEVEEIEDNSKTENEVKDLTVKKNKEEMMINPAKMEKIEEEIKKQTTISDERKNKINKSIFHNIAIANVIMLYFIFIVLGYQTITPDKFIIDLQVFSVITMGIAIIVFEKAYKKDSTEYAIHGIESLFLSIVTLISIYVFSKYREKFADIMIIVCYLFAIYYVAKSIIIYLKMKTKALERTSDIRKIVKNRR